MIEPLKTQLAKIQVRHGIGRAAQHDGRGTIEQRAVVVGADQQRMVGVLAIAMMLREIVKRADFAATVTAGHRQNQDLDFCELLLERDPLLPVPVVARMSEPAMEYLARLFRESIQIGVRLSASVPGSVALAPRRVVV